MENYTIGLYNPETFHFLLNQTKLSKRELILTLYSKVISIVEFIDLSKEDPIPIFMIGKVEIVPDELFLINSKEHIINVLETSLKMENIILK